MLIYGVSSPYSEAYKNVFQRLKYSLESTSSWCHFVTNYIQSKMKIAFAFVFVFMATAANAIQWSNCKLKTYFWGSFFVQTFILRKFVSISTSIATFFINIEPANLLKSILKMRVRISWPKKSETLRSIKNCRELNFLSHPLIVDKNTVSM